MIDPERFAGGMARQLERLRSAWQAGMPRRGWKVGINVPELRTRLGLPHPGVGWLDGARVFASGSALPGHPGSRLHVEPEIALSISERVAPASSPGLAQGCIAFVHPALEIVDYSRAGKHLDDVVAHCMFHDATVLGPPSRPEVARDLGSRWPRLRVAGRSADPPRGDLVPADLGELVAFVAAYLAAFGQSLEAGDLILTGSYTARALPIAPGEEASAEFGPLGIVSVRIPG